MLFPDHTSTAGPNTTPQPQQHSGLTSRTLRHLFSALGLLLAAATSVHGQCRIISISGYTVTASVYPIELIPSSTNCEWGYNYNVKLAYDISFVGAVAPTSMYTLQGNVICGSQSLFFDLPNTGGSGTVTTTSNAWRGLTDCASAGLGTLSCYTVKLQIQGPSISNRTVICDFSPLPVELVSFAAAPSAHGVAISWTTASEKDSDHFVVERSSDGTVFTPVLRMDAQGQSNKLVDYQALDPDPVSGLAYYRIRQVDTNGEEFLGPWAAVESKLHERKVAVYPNPNAGRTLQVQNAAIGSVLQLCDATGKPTLRLSITSEEVHLPDLAPGVYVGSITPPHGARSSFRYIQL